MTFNRYAPNICGDYGRPFGENDNTFFSFFLNLRFFKLILKIKYYYWILTWQKCTLSHCSSVLNTIWIHLLTFWFTHSALLYLLTGYHMLPFATFPFISMVLAATRGRGLQYELWQWRYMYPLNHSCISFRFSSPRNASYNWCLVEFQNQIG